MDKKRLTGMATFVMAGMLTAMTAVAQTGSTTGSTGATGSSSDVSGTATGPTSGATDPSASPNASAMDAASTSGTSASMGDLSSGDKKFVADAAQGGMEEVELGKLATTNASSAAVKSFGQRMVDDHTKANDQLKQVAQSKGITLPSEVSHSQRKDIDHLSKLNGAEFDRAYMRMMVSDHKKDVSEFKKESKNGKDSDVKSFASTTLPTLEDHLKMAVDTASKVSSTTTTSSMSKKPGPYHP